MRGCNIQVEAKSLLSNSGFLETPCSVPSLNTHNAHLISIRMKFDNGYTVDTLIDCGSELDIINKTTCMKGEIPIDTSLTTYMCDAGLHDTLMEG